MTTPSDGTTPAGWYPDPNIGGQQRYWDGQQWTESTAAVSPAAPPAPVPYVPPTPPVLPVSPQSPPSYGQPQTPGYGQPVMAAYGQPMPPAKSGSGRWWILGILAAVAAVGLVLVVAAVFLATATRTISSTSVATEIEKGLVEKTGQSFEVTCPPDQPMEQGYQFTCTGISGTGLTITIIVTQENDSGNFTWKASNSDGSGTPSPDVSIL